MICTRNSWDIANIHLAPMELHLALICLLFFFLLRFIIYLFPFFAYINLCHIFIFIYRHCFIEIWYFLLPETSLLPYKLISVWNCDFYLRFMKAEIAQYGDGNAWKHNRRHIESQLLWHIYIYICAKYMYIYVCNIFMCELIVLTYERFC